MHSLLQRQLRRIGLSADALPSAEQWRAFLERISRAYHDADQERYLLERSLQLSSDEMLELYESLRASSETKLAAERNRLRAVIGSLGAGLIILDPSGVIRSLNPEAERLLGTCESELAGRYFSDILLTATPPSAGADLDEDSESIPSVDAISSLSEPHHVDDARLRCADQTTLRVSYALNPIFEDKTLAGVAVVFLDISARKAAEEERDRFFRLSLDLFCAIQPNGIPYRLNAAWELLGYTIDELMHQDMFALVHPDDRTATLRALTTIDAQGVAQRFENRIRCKDGSYRWLQWAAVMCENPRLLYAVARDVSVEKNRERELRVAKEAAEAAARTKSSFLANMSHEMRTPLNAIIGITGLLMDQPMAPEARELLQTVAASSSALLSVINDVLDYSKIEAGMMDLMIRPFPLIECIESSMDLLASKAAESGLELILDIDDSVPPEATGDAGRLRQVLLNLLSNAVKFTPEGGEVVLSARATLDHTKDVTDPPWRLHVAVRDTGIGIAPADQERLFTSFTQLESGQVRKHTGTGLGLTICRKLCRLMGGDIRVDSVPGHGSTFRFTVSLGAHGAAQNASVAPGLRDRRVLVAIGNRTNRAVLSSCLERRGATTITASSAREALDACSALERLDFALIDIAVPEVSPPLAPGHAPQTQTPGHDPQAGCQRRHGIALTRDIRARFQRGVRIVLMTEFDQQVPGQRTEADLYLSKPIKTRRLVHALTAPLDTDTQAPPRPRAITLDTELGKKLPLTILVAEDNPVNQRVARKVLERMGYQCEIAENGLEAVARVESEHYDLVLMDMQMPEMDGLEAARQIRERGRDISQPIIIAMTANATAQDREACLDAGMDGFISKPVPVEEVQSMLEQWGPVARERQRQRRAHER